VKDNKNKTMNEEVAKLREKMKNCKHCMGYSDLVCANKLVGQVFCKLPCNFYEPKANKDTCVSNGM